MDVKTDLYKKLRIERGYTQADVSKHLGVSQAFISQIESGSRAPSYELLSKIAEFYCIKTSEITIEPKPIVKLIRKLKLLKQSDYDLVGAMIDRFTK